MLSESQEKPNSANFIFLSVAVLILSMEVLMLVVWAFSHIPLKPFLGAGKIFPEAISLFRPEREGMFYALFIGITVVMQTAALFMFRKQLARKEFLKELRPFVFVEGILLSLLLCAAFKTIIYDYRAQLAHRAFAVLLLVVILNKVFWPQLKDFGRAVYSFISSEANAGALRKLLDIFSVALIFLIIYMPNPEAVVARMFIGEQFHHFNHSLMGPGWSFISGVTLNIDCISPYGLGLPVIISQLSKLLGGFNYLNVFLVTLYIYIVYFLLWYWLLRKWLQSILWSLFAIVTAIKVQMFHTGVYPLVLTYPSATVIRYCFDIFFMWAMFYHVQTHRRIFLPLAGILCGVAMFHLTDTGIYLTAAFYAYLLIHLVIPHFRGYVYQSKKDIAWLLLDFVLPVIVALFLFWLIEGHYLWTKEYWDNTIEFIGYFTSGFGATPMSESMHYKKFWSSSIGFFMPLVYVFTLTVVGTLCFLRKIRYGHMFVVLLCLYGLGSYHYYVLRSEESSYYVSGLPFVFILAYWLKNALTVFSPTVQRNAAICAVCFTLFGLATNHNFVSYPNALNVSRNPLTDMTVAMVPPGRASYFNHLFREYPDAFKLPVNSLGETEENLKIEKDFVSDDDLKEYYKKEFDFTQDAQLIASLTKPDEKVAVLSSFDIKMLMQAKRKPFFYFFPFVNERPMRMRIFVVSRTYTYTELKRTMDQLINAKPKYVFMERIFLNTQVPQAYYADSPGFMPVRDYVLQHYEPSAYGQYLVAMKIKIEDASP